MQPERHPAEPTRPPRSGQAGRGQARAGGARVGVVMGSDSDWPVMRAAVEALEELGLAAEVAVASAHRTPQRVEAWASSAAARGLQVIIAGAGGAAHLPGVIAAWTFLPVIGVPVALPASGPGPDGARWGPPLGGLDALLSIVQMPPGVPVACVGINGARNAGILAAQILALGDPELAERLRAFRLEQARRVEERERKLLEQLGGPQE